ncbi:MAG TPA: hypothetical protein VED40_11400 [Azospirillaceae bacterium]|nr:hypothetical protein [Azospirillaceae bacterium]
MRPPSAGMFLRDHRGRLIANVSSPVYALLAYVLLSYFPYLVPMEYMAIIKIVDPLQHTLNCLVLGGVLLGLYVLYGAITAPTFDPRPQRFSASHLEALRVAMLSLMWLGVVANALVLAYSVPHYRGSVFDIKDAMANLEGVNILTQSYLFAIGPYIYLCVVSGKPYRKVLVALGVVLLLRALLMAERLALLEFMVPLLVVLSLLRQMFIPAARLALIGVAVPVLFVIAEIFRSFYAKFVEDTGWAHLDIGFVLQWNLERLALYYTDVTNKSYFIMNEQFFHITEYWSSGVLRMIGRFTGYIPEKNNAVNFFAHQFDVGNEEMTNPGGLAMLMSDFGWWGFAVLLAFILSMFLTHWRAAKGHILSLGLYPILFLNFLELPRIVYIYNSRAIFPLLLFFAAYFAAVNYARPGLFRPSVRVPDPHHGA